MSEPTIFLFAGEKSGDLLGSRLLKDLKRQLPTVAIWGVGGEKMRGLGLDTLMRTEEFEVMGIADALLTLPKSIRQFHRLRNAILKRNPTVCVLIDYPGFNLRLAKSLRKRGYRGKIIQYVCPTIWAWGAGRKKTLIETLDLLLTIYPFEKKLFEDTPLNVDYVGNPIFSSVDEHVYQENWMKLFGLAPSHELIALFPGSRKGEIHRNLPLQLKTAALIKENHPQALFAISLAHDNILPEIYPILNQSSLKLHRDVYLIPKTFSYELMQDCRLAIAKSGSVTLELALHKTPTVVTYEVTKLNRFIAKYLLRLKLDHFCITNILNETEVFPEFIKMGNTPANIANAANQLLDNASVRDQCMDGCERVRSLLNHGEKNSATVIKELIS